MDDFYIVSSGLAVTETTNDIFNKSLFSELTSNSVPTGFRAMVANRLAENSNQWTEIFKEENSGTYNNQWVIIDYTKINVSSGVTSIGPDFFWMLEQLP